MKNTIAVTVIVAVICIIIQMAAASVISIEPSYLNVSPGDEFTVDIMVDPEGNETYAASYTLYFNTTLLNASSVVKGTFLSQDGAQTWQTRNETDNTNGTIEYGECRKNVEYGVTNPGVLATITFQALANGFCELGISDIDGVILANPNYTSIPTEVMNGSIEIRQPSSPFFDTGAPENPYPSISGTHNGTIKHNRTIYVNRIYTYSCPGTNGHSEYVAFYNTTTGKEIANGTWEGYKGDWHNITFREPFELQAGTSYNYTLKTGSYPQIIHATGPEYNATGGKITCTEFIDVNGEVHENWVPAIRLWEVFE